MSPSPAPEPERIGRLARIAEVRYSLPEMLEELKLERSAGSFAMEKLNQVEITKVFKSKKAKRRA
jgi:DNA-binding transcriptional regulator GbsR (MarR family)